MNTSRSNTVPVLIWFLGAMGTPAAIIGGVLLAHDSYFPALILVGVWFAMVATLCCIVRQQRCGDVQAGAIGVAWLWGLTWWVIPWMLTLGGVEIELAGLVGVVAGAAITCWVVWVMTRFGESVGAAVAGAVSIATGPAMAVLWGAFVFAGLAYWASGAMRPRRPGLCERCGYSLRGLPVIAVCPECGTAIMPADLATALDRFVRATLRHDEAAKRCARASESRAAVEQLGAFRHIVALGDDATERFLELLDHPDRLIAGAAAAYALGLDEERCAALLRSIAAQEDPVGRRAALALQNWKVGRWPLDLPATSTSGATGADGPATPRGA